MVDITCLGGGKEVGRTAVSVESNNEKFIFDYGIDVQDMKVPINPGKNITAVFLSHAHLDHSGYIPNLYKRGYSGSVYATPATFELAAILLRDSIKVQERKGIQPQFLINDVKKMEHLKRAINIGKKMKFKNSSAEFFNSGHVPGGCTTLLEIGGKRILYTGDTKFVDTDLMKAGFTDYKNIDFLITETTYSQRNHPNRKMLRDELREIAQNTIYNSGTLLLPAFAIGRTQELLVMMYDLGFDIYMDGMGIAATKAMLSHPKSVVDSKKLTKAFGMAHKIRNARQRENVIKRPCIVITTAGMLNGGPICYYMEKLHKRENCTMVMTGYQVEGTVGRRLLDTGRYVNEGLDIKPKMDIKTMDFSAHCGRDSLIDFIKKVKPKKTLLFHGDQTEKFAAELNGMGFEAIAANNGDKIKI
jgi:putative mRNA 3-end processing factor